MTKKILFLLGFFVVNSMAACPDPATIAPCACEEGNLFDRRYTVTCRDGDLASIKAALASSFDNPGFKTIQIWHSNLGDIPADFFAEKSADFVHLGNNEITSIDMAAFSGMKARIQTLEIYGSPSLTSFDFSQLDGFTLLTRFNLGFTGITEVTPFPVLSNLRYINLGYNEINTIVPYSFDGALDLQELSLKSNKLVALGDYWLSLQTPRDLVLIDLTNNEIESISSLTFPRIGVSYEIEMARNRFTTVPEDVFRPLLEQFGLFGYIDLYPGVSTTGVLSGNEIVCDCNVAWLVRAEGSIANRLQRAYCAHNSFPISQLPSDYFDGLCL